jgi:hypothetical protein
VYSQLLSQLCSQLFINFGQLFSYYPVLGRRADTQIEPDSTREVNWAANDVIQTADQIRTFDYRLKN